MNYLSRYRVDCVCSQAEKAIRDNSILDLDAALDKAWCIFDIVYVDRSDLEYDMLIQSVVRQAVSYKREAMLKHLINYYAGDRFLKVARTNSVRQALATIRKRKPRMSYTDTLFRVGNEVGELDRVYLKRKRHIDEME